MSGPNQAMEADAKRTRGSSPRRWAEADEMSGLDKPGGRAFGATAPL
jgi:hypothetical protein